MSAPPCQPNTVIHRRPSPMRPATQRYLSQFNTKGRRGSGKARLLGRRYGTVCGGSVAGAGCRGHVRAAVQRGSPGNTGHQIRLGNLQALTPRNNAIARGRLPKPRARVGMLGNNGAATALLPVRHPPPFRQASQTTPGSVTRVCLGLIYVTRRCSRHQAIAPAVVVGNRPPTPVFLK